MLTHVILLLTLISALFVIRKASGITLILGLALIGLIASIETSIKFATTQLNEIPYVSLHGLKSMSLELSILGFVIGLLLAIKVIRGSKEVMPGKKSEKLKPQTTAAETEPAEGKLDQQNLADERLTEGKQAEGKLAEEKGILAGVELAKEVFRLISREKVEFSYSLKDRDILVKGEPILVVKSETLNILKGERTALNFLSR